VQHLVLNLLIADGEKDDGQEDQVEQHDQQDETHSRIEGEDLAYQSFARLQGVLVNHARSTVLRSGHPAVALPLG
jgi:hypothetical protein